MEENEIQTLNGMLMEAVNVRPQLVLRMEPVLYEPWSIRLHLAHVENTLRRPPAYYSAEAQYLSYIQPKDGAKDNPTLVQNTAKIMPLVPSRFKSKNLVLEDVILWNETVTLSSKLGYMASPIEEIIELDHIDPEF